MTNDQAVNKLTEAKAKLDKATYHIDGEAKIVKGIKDNLRSIDRAKGDIHTTINTIGQDLSLARNQISDNETFGAWRTVKFPDMPAEYGSAYIFCFDNADKINKWMKANPKKFDLTSPRSIQRQFKAKDDKPNDKGKGKKKGKDDNASALLNSLDGRTEQELLDGIKTILDKMNAEKTAKATAFTDKAKAMIAMSKTLTKLSK